MNVFNTLRDTLDGILGEMKGEGSLPEDISFKAVAIEPPRDKSHGDVAINAALVLAKAAGKNPRELAEIIAKKLEALEFVGGVDIAGPGFINLKLTPAFWQGRVPDILKSNKAYGASKAGGGAAVNVEYVSANPTGPMHVGHVRGAVFGDALANLLEKVGHKVTKEYYTNDAGVQIDALARSVHLRYREALGEEIFNIPDGLYPGEYLIPLGKKLAKKYGDKFKEAGEGDWLKIFKKASVAAMMDLIRGDLAALGIRHDVFFSEQSLLDSDLVAKTIGTLKKKGLIYEGILEPPKGKKPEGWEPREQTLFRATDFGDDVDRPLVKFDGSYTYFASDIAYHYDKIQRGFMDQIVILGADHGGYGKRIQAVVIALSEGKARLDAKFCQLVKLYRGGTPVKMSKRSGHFVTLREVVDEVGAGVLRFIMLTRKNEAPLDFDFEKVKEQSRENPVFYVQYAHARAHSVFKKAAEIMPALATGLDELQNADFSRLVDPAEIDLVRTLAVWPRTVEAAAEAHEPHRIAFYLYDLASEFHALWNKGNDDPDLRFVIEGDDALTLARLALVRALALVIAEGLEVLGVEPLKEMH
ncbi:MAG: arginine--tRNA ligase [Sphingomonadales bacterium]